MTDPRTVLIQKFAEIAALTKPKCAGTGGIGSCNPVQSCCGDIYCEEAVYHAKKYWNTDLPRTGHPTLPMMSATGCTVPPHMRPACAIHVCEAAYAYDLKFREKYFTLREEINEAMHAIREDFSDG